MSLLKRTLLLSLFASFVASPTELSAAGHHFNEEVEHGYLEEVLGEKALAWVNKQNTRSFGVLKNDPVYESIFERSKALYDAKDKIPYGTFHNGKIYNFWQDADHPRGILRVSDPQSYLSSAPQWDTVLDIDALGRAEGKSWVYKSQLGLEGTSRTLVTLSPGGSDAAEVREFDLSNKSFVQGGFRLPAAKSTFAWVNEETLLVGSATDAGTSTDSGYPRKVALWTRGSALDSAKVIFEGEKTDVGVWASRMQSGNFVVNLIIRSVTFYEGEYHYVQGDKTTKLELPRDAEVSEFFQGYLIVSLKSDWTVAGRKYLQGSFVSVKLSSFLQDAQTGVELIIAPTSQRTVESAVASRDALYVSILENVRGKALRFVRGKAGWESSELALPQFGTVSLSSANSEGDDVLVDYQDFLTPTSLFHVSKRLATPRSIYSLPSRFDASKYFVEQHFATSKDGTKVPYFLVGPKNMARNKKNPTLLYGYGGFEASQKPYYLAQLEHAWLARGGVYALANIRGGGEFGPAWHRAALKENRQRAFDDFIAIGEHLIERDVTSPRHLGIMGGSNGGLLVGAVMTQRPDLFNAVVVQVPLLDMLRFHKLLAGASWMGEYGNPEDPAMAEIIAKYSPYQNVFADKKYPKPFFMTSTRDDRVHPGHARRMAAKMEEQGHEFLYYENTEGGHGGSADNSQRATWNALQYTYLKQQLID